MVGMEVAERQMVWGQTEQVQLNNKPMDAYDFPIKPGTKEWKALSSHDKMVEACQIPENILKKMSTEGLIETCLNYPLVGGMFASNNIQSGFNSIVSKFNGLQELLQRKDVGSKLLMRYRQFRKLDSQTLKKELGDTGLFHFLSFEVLISQDAVLSKMTKGERIELLKECVVKYQEKRKYPDTFGYILGETAIPGAPETILIMGRVLQYEEYKLFKIKVQDNKLLQDFLKGNHMPRHTIENLADEIILPEIEKYIQNEGK